jgi:hypothetical protein
MIKPMALTLALAIALAPAAALAEVSGGYSGAPLPPFLASHHACDGAPGAAPTEPPRLAATPRRNARHPTVPWSCCVTGMCTEGGGF